MKYLSPKQSRNLEKKTQDPKGNYLYCQASGATPLFDLVSTAHNRAGSFELCQTSGLSAPKKVLGSKIKYQFHPIGKTRVQFVYTYLQYLICCSLDCPRECEPGEPGIFSPEFPVYLYYKILQVLKLNLTLAKRLG